MGRVAIVIFSIAFHAYSLFGQELVFKSDFEQPNIGPVPGYRPYVTGETVSGWLVTQGDVDQVSKNFAYFGLSKC
jgi:hypothetical protein